MSHDLISYRHRADTLGKTRYIAPAGDRVPSWAVDVRPHVEPWPPQTTPEDILRWLGQGLFAPLSRSRAEDMFLDASPAALYHEDSETGEEVLLDLSTSGGITAEVIRGELAWRLPLDGSAPEAL